MKNFFFTSSCIYLAFFCFFIRTHITVTVSYTDTSALEVAIEQYNIQEVIRISSSLSRLNKDYEKSILAALDQVDKQKLHLDYSLLRGASLLTRITDLSCSAFFGAAAYRAGKKMVYLNTELNLPVAFLELQKDNYLLSTLKKGLFGESTNVKILQDTNLIKTQSTAYGFLAATTTVAAALALRYFLKACIPLQERTVKREKLLIMRSYLEHILTKKTLA